MLSNMELIPGLLSCDQQLGLAGVQLRIINGVVRSIILQRNRYHARRAPFRPKHGLILSLDIADRDATSIVTNFSQSRAMRIRFAC
jgi:hypothetical protein